VGTARAVVALEMAWRGPFEPLASNVAEVRSFAKERFADVSHRSLGDVVLVVSELVTNVVGHAHTRFCVGLGLVPGVARIEVADHAPWTPSQGFPSLDLRGRGLLVVRALCENWGVEFLEDTKKVWAELAVSMPVSALRWR
jgi:anti-sigma regulatory factor (Ser/Thr protein kinase)